ncbi:hypothetical protein K435DRAFT_871131 [Dendrothele bispora CBS 962.96]|uniref:Uncharacterized protein n=1 Tax=Dendrothele bispora (strain CBS 962.96) TaxID=1314807 RepID=A0A4S8L4T7_DENBC|nr:hypothetical protein K435DRAFT_871131 [Dendrothele bispora CBS 962.96]
MSAPNTPSHSFPRNLDTPATPSHTSPSHSHSTYSYHVPPPNYAYYHTYPFNPQIQQYGLPPGGFSSQTMQPIQFHDMTNQITQAASASVASVSTNKRKRNTRSRPNKNSRTSSTRAAPEGTQTHQNESDPVVDSDVEPDPESSTPIVRLTGVGPINTSHEPSAFEADTHYGSLVRHPKEQNATDASDVWYFMRALKSDGPLNSLPPGEEPNWLIRPPKNEYTHLGCKLCPLTRRAWRNSDGQTKTLRKHLRSHGKTWTEIILIKKLKGWEKLARDLPTETETRARPPFTLEGFYERLLKWIAVDDQPGTIVVVGPRTILRTLV